MLHIVQDEKFSPGSIRYFVARKDLSCQFVFFQWRSKEPLRFLQDYEQVKVLKRRKQLILELQSDDYDVLYLHGLYITFWPMLKYVPKTKIIIWWLWGYEVYLPSPYGQKRSFFSIQTILPLTKIAIDESKSLHKRLVLFVKGSLIDVVWPYYKRKIVTRIDYFRPVIHPEFVLMNQIKGFHAKEFYLPRLDPSKMYHGEGPITLEEGSIQIGNSASAFCNHLDVWERIKRFVPEDRTVVMPLSYGDRSYAEYIKIMVERDHAKLDTMESFLPREEYFKKVNECTYFVHGAIRQHAMGNINKALVSGRKVFLFKDSMIYKYLIDNGFAVFAIEDIDEHSFFTPLTHAEFQQNILARKRDLDFRDDIGQRVLKEIEEEISLG